MKVHNELPEQDRVRAESVTPTPVMLAKAQYCGIMAFDLFAKKFMNPVLETQLALSHRESVLQALFLRTIGYWRSLLVLNNAIHFQSVSSATRSIIEIYVDMELIHKNVVPDGVERALTFAEVQRLKGATNVVRFHEANPGLDPGVSDVVLNPAREYVKHQKARIDADTENFWGKDKHGKPRRPVHWSDLDLKARATKLGKSVELLVNQGYDYRNWFVHSGVAGIVGLDVDTFTNLCAVAYKSVCDAAGGALRIIGGELKLKTAIASFEEQIEELGKVPAWTLLDESLKSLGEPSRFWIEDRIAPD